jgi:hypothetical protein
MKTMKPRSYLEHLKKREEVLLQPILKVPYSQMPVRDVGMKKRLVSKISARVLESEERHRILQGHTL